MINHMYNMKTVTTILLSSIYLYLLSGSGCARSNSTSMDTNMKQQIYTLGEWHVREGRQQEFIAAWKELGTIFASLPEPPGKGILIQSTSDSTLFYSFGPWNSIEAVETMRGNPQAEEGIRKLIDLCTEASPGSFRVVAESPGPNR